MGVKTIFYIPLTGEAGGSWCRGLYTDVSYSDSYVTYGNNYNGYNTKQIYLNLFSVEPIANQYGSKIYNYHYRYDNRNNKSTPIDYQISQARSSIEFESLLDFNDRTTNIMTELSINRFGLITSRIENKHNWWF